MPQPPHMDPLPHDPLPATISQGSPMWRLRISGDRMVFCGRTFGVHVAFGLLLIPVVYVVCERWGAARNLQIGLSLFPLFYAGGMVVGSLFTLGFPRFEYDMSRQRVVLPLGREIVSSDILAVQVIEYARRWGDDDDDDELLAYQLNLCYRGYHKPERMHLAECSYDEPLLRDARLLANTLGVPLHERYLPIEALLAAESAVANTQLASWLVVPGIMATMLYAGFGLAIARKPQWPRWNDPLWIGLLIPTLLLVVVIWHLRTRKHDRDRRIARSEQAAMLR